MSALQKNDRLTRCWTVDSATAEAFMALSGDTNPIHADDAYARARGYRARLAHGALLHAYLSGFVGTGLPAKDTLCLQQKLAYRHPFFVGDTIALEALVTQVQPAPFQDDKEIVEFDVLFRRGGDVVASGTLQVLVGRS